MDKQKLISQMGAGTARVGRIIEALPWEKSTFYANWCAQTFKYVCHSAPLIKKCAEGLPPGETKTDMEHHYREEAGHEVFAARDAAVFGIDARNAEELAATRAVYAGIYKAIDQTPVAMFGYALALESISKHYGPYLAARLAQAFAVTPKPNHALNTPVSFLTLHAEVDQGHADEGVAALNRILPEDLGFVAEVMERTFSAYANFLRSIEAFSA